MCASEFYHNVQSVVVMIILVMIVAGIIPVVYFHVDDELCIINADSEKKS